MVTAFGLDNLTCFGMLVALLDTFPPGTLFIGSRLASASTSVRIEDSNDIFKRHAMLAKRCTKLFLEIDLFLKLAVNFKRLKTRLMFGDLRFQLAKLCNTRHV
ncbi:hypothetical protein UM91_13340 [Pseudomonas oryzihabitans]|nr:hypothetical protein UM91_13340 [Pseudomonas oryzihabitans]